MDTWKDNIKINFGKIVTGFLNWTHLNENGVNWRNGKKKLTHVI